MCLLGFASPVVLSRDKATKFGESSQSSMPKERNVMVANSSSSRNGGEAHDLASNLKNISFPAESGPSNDTNPGRENSRAQFKPEKWMLPEKAEHSLTQLNLAIVYDNLRISRNRRRSRVTDAAMESIE
ncbi:hypothetical protein V6N12_018466 [Hibiscus sabdariffa]|uniref:Uncharacterized protein n=1 Tax=Hibiscus sabdariffa TaxID=183260 RepID=A0ABR2BQG3_9ROSI